MTDGSYRVLVACEFSNTVRDAFITEGFRAISCDLQPPENGPPHIKADVRTILDDGWDLMIAHPPCTYLCNSGVRWLYEKQDRWQKMIEGAVFFRNLLTADIPHIAVENPVMHKYARQVIGRSHDQSIQPYEFGHPESKRTCFWLRNLPELQPTEVLAEPEGGVWENQTPSGQNKLGPSDDRWKERSRFYEGIAEAMAEQWGAYLRNNATPVEPTSSPTQITLNGGESA